MQSYVFGEAFAVPPAKEMCPFGDLMRSIAECDTLLAEELLVLYAHSDFVSHDRFRRSYVLQALGYLHPKTVGTYSLLAREMVPQPSPEGPKDFRDFLLHSDGHYAGDSLRSLVRIADDRAAGVIRSVLFSDPGAWTKSPSLDFFLGTIAAGRREPANFGLLVTLAKDAPDPDMQGRILHLLEMRTTSARARLP